MSRTLSEGQRVDVARGSLPQTPHFEHERAEVYARDVAVERAVSSRQRISQSRNRRGTQSLIDELFGHGRRSGGPLVEVMSLVDPDRHAETTYYHVVFESGGQGVYPEDCLVPTPADVLAGDDEDTTTGKEC